MRYTFVDILMARTISLSAMVLIGTDVKGAKEALQQQLDEHCPGHEASREEGKRPRGEREHRKAEENEQN